MSLAQPLTVAASAANPPRRSVLVVDDVAATRHGLVELLRLRGYTAYEASNGAEALTCLRRHSEIGAVVLDVGMPETNGFWFRDRQLQDPRVAAIPVVVFTGSTDVFALDALNAAEVLFKPFSVDRVFEAIARHCG